jgi:hypothetical protein
MNTNSNTPEVRNNGGVDPIALPLARATLVSGLSRSELYRRLAAGDIRAVKAGKRTLILADSLRAFLAGLPTAEFRAPPADRAAAAERAAPAAAALK